MQGKLEKSYEVLVVTRPRFRRCEDTMEAWETKPGFCPLPRIRFEEMQRPKKKPKRKDTRSSFYLTNLDLREWKVSMKTQEKRTNFLPFLRV